MVVPPATGDCRYAKRAPAYAAIAFAAPDSDGAVATVLTSDDGVALQPAGRLVAFVSKLSNAHMCDVVTDGVTVDV